MKKQFLVIGLGQFGGSITEHLIAQGHEVLAIDKDEHKVNEFMDIATQVIKADATDEQVLKNIGAHNFYKVVVAIGNDMEASILTTLALKDLGVKHVMVKAVNESHRKVLQKIGADEVINPERDMGKRAASHLISHNIIEYLELSSEHSLIEMVAAPQMHGSTIGELNIRAKYGCNIIAIKSQDNRFNISPKPEDEIRPGDVLVIVGSNREIQSLEKALFK